MELSPYVEALRREFDRLTRFAPGEVATMAAQLADALDSAVRLTLLDVLAAAAAEVSSQLGDAVVDVRLGAGRAKFVVTALPPQQAHDLRAEYPAPTDGTTDEAGVARITLRISEALKTRVDAAATAEGMSVNSWLAHAALQALGGRGGPGRPPGPGIGQRITGYARG
jgi:hypothetical protein